MFRRNLLMKKRKLFSLMLGLAVMMILMIAMAQVSFAEGGDTGMVYQPASSLDDVTLQMLEPDPLFNYEWKPSFSSGDVLMVTENGVETKYVCDNVYYSDNEVRGFFDDDGNALNEKYRCYETIYDGVLTGFYPDFEWVGGTPAKSGKYASYRLLLYEKGSSEGSKPVLKSNPIKIYVEPVGEYDGIRYGVAADGYAMVDYVMDYKEEYKIRKKVKLDNGKTYKVTHIGGADVNGSLFDDGGSFGGVATLTSVKIPDTITSIKSMAFLGTPLMTEVVIPPSVKKIGKYAVGYDGNYDFFGGKIEGLEKIEGFTIYAKAGSEGARYARENGFTCIDLDAQKKGTAADAAYAKAKFTSIRVKGVKVKAGKKKMTVKWKKVSDVTGYEIRYSTDKNFKKNVKTKKVTTYKKKGVTIKKLKKNKKYYVQVRTYKKVNGKTYRGKWSAKKSAKIK